LEDRNIRTLPSTAVESAVQTLRWALRTYRERIVLAVSFGGLGGLVTLDLALRIDPQLPVYYLDTGLLFAQTYEFVATVEARYGIRVTAVKPELSLDEQARLHGDALWARDPDACCALRKVAPQRLFLSDYDAWITGLHQNTLETRRDLPRIQWDDQSQVIKVSPLAHWTDADLAAYAAEHGIVANPLLEAGYTSIGCVPCTRRVGADEDPRSGRWPGFAKLECGLHARGAGSGPDRTSGTSGDTHDADAVT
jgi:phosphoadenosine phosphosulfate reductase